MEMFWRKYSRAIFCMFWFPEKTSTELGGFERIPIHFYCLKFSLPTQFCIWRCSGGNIHGLFSECFDFQKTLPQNGAFLVWSRNQLETKVCFKWNYARDTFSGRIICKEFYGERAFSARMDLSGGNLNRAVGGLHWKKLPWKNFSWGGVYFMEGEPDLTTLMKK